jgi:diguanylate cyclase (GGDEF)-like protein
MKLPRATWVVVALSVAGGAAALAVAAWSLPAWTAVAGRQWPAAVVTGLLMAASWTWPVLVYRGTESEAVHLDEGFFVLLALLVPPVLTLGTLALATTAAQAARRRSPVKSAFNTGQVLVSAGLGLAAGRALAVPAATLTATQVGAAILGVAVYCAVNTLLVSGVAVSLGATWPELTADLPAQLSIAGAGALAGLVLALAITAQGWALVLAPPALIVQRHLISGRFAALHDRARMEGLYQAALEAHRGLRPEVVLETILAAVKRLLRSPQARLSSAGPESGDLAAPLPGPGEQWLVATGRRRDEPFDEADSRLLRALAAVGSGALRNAELHQQVQAERERLAAITLSLGEGVCAIAPDDRVTFVNRAAAEMVDLPELSRAPDFLLGPARRAIRTGNVIRDDDASFRGRGGGTVPVAFTATAISGGTTAGAVIAFRDITERKAFEEELRRFAFYDSLTGLANRRLLVDRLDQALRRPAAERGTHALVFVDVDRFKSINDSLGHVTGDGFLVAMAERLRSAVRGGDLVARFGGDEFVVLMPDVAGAAAAVEVARRICAAAAAPILLPEGYELVASVSVGIALTGPGKSADDVLRDADVAMYEAKARDRGGGYRVFDQAAMGRRSAERLHFEADLRKGIERDELEVRYQPVYSLAGQRIVGAEALVRWRHPEHGLIGPRQFIPVAEETGLILALGRYVLDQACREIRAIRDRLELDLPISVNLSPRQFSDSGLLRQVSAILAEHGLPPRLLTFEITETMIMEDLPGARETMARLSGLGARIAIDDFGTGHSSLAYLKQFPVQAVKVDRSFVQGIASDPVDLAIVRAIVDLANALGIASVAEGVETQEQVTRLRAVGCQVGQGFYFSRPLAAAAFEDLLTRHCTPEAALRRVPGVQQDEP